MKVFLNPEFDNSKLNPFGFLATIDGIIFQEKQDDFIMGQNSSTPMHATI